MTSFSLQDPDLFRRQAYVGGHWCDADNGATLDVNNPATGEVLGTVPLMGTAEKLGAPSMPPRTPGATGGASRRKIGALFFGSGMS
jgi:hypothetical protein